MVWCGVWHWQHMCVRARQTETIAQILIWKINKSFFFLDDLFLWIFPCVRGGFCKNEKEIKMLSS